MKHQLLLVAVAIPGALVGRLTSPHAHSLGTARAATLPQAKPPGKPPRFPGGRGHADATSKGKARDEVAAYQRVHPMTADTPKTYFIKSEVVQSILKQKGCIGLRIYPAYVGTTKPFEPSLVVVGVEQGDKGYQDQVGTYSEKNAALRKEYIVGQTDDRCPYSCDGTGY